MMYRVEIDVGFIDEKTAQDVIAFVVSKKEAMIIPENTFPIPQERKIRYHKCYHDEKEPAACEPMINSDVTRSDEASVLAAREADKLEGK